MVGNNGGWLLPIKRGLWHFQERQIPKIRHRKFRPQQRDIKPTECCHNLYDACSRGVKRPNQAAVPDSAPVKYVDAILMTVYLAIKYFPRYSVVMYALHSQYC